MTNCPFCGKLTDPKLDLCPHCGGSLQKGAAGLPPGPPTRRQTCPNCHALVEEGDIICVACGTNLLTGQKIADERKEAGRSPRQVLLIAALGVAAVVVLVGLIWGLAILTRDPVNRAIELAQQGKFSEATEMLREHVSKNPADARAHFELGRLLWVNNPRSAADAFERVSELDPDNVQAALLTVCSLAGSNEPERQIAALRRVVKVEQDNWRAWYLLGLALGRRNDVEGQIDALERVKALNPSNPSVREQLGVAYALKGNYGSALQELEAAIQMAPEKTDVRAAMGFVASLDGEYEEALAQLRQALEGDVAVSSRTLTQLGLLLVARGRFRQAEDYLRRVAPESPLARLLYGLSLREQGLIEEALAEFDRLVKAKGEYAHEAAIHMANAYLATGEIEAARQALEQAEMLGAPNAALYTARGRVLAQSGEDAAAQNAFRQALQLNPDYAPAHLENGLLYVKRQVFSEAVVELERYLDLVGEDTEGTPAQEIAALVQQLRQTTGDMRLSRMPGQSVPERSAS